MLIALGGCHAFCQKYTEKQLSMKVDSVLKLMTLEEKVGQINQLAGDFSTGAQVEKVKNLEEEIRKGRVGSFLNIGSLEEKIKVQKIAIEQSRLKIPLIIAFDVIHGFETTFPFPLAEASCFDELLAEKSARVAATESAAWGFHWTFAPMVDVSRDPRWGRVMEGAGEDTWWNSKIAAAKVRGFQGDDLSKDNTIAACAKHFAAYALVEAGREYSNVDVSELLMREIYFPPFKAAVDAGVATIMNSFTVYNRIPASCNNFLVKQVLKEEWGFKGYTISDWGSLWEIINHGAAKDKVEAAFRCINAKSDMDMEGHVYSAELANLVKNGKVKESLVDEAVGRVLRIKFMLGLFDDPYRYFNPKRIEERCKTKESRLLAREIAKKSFVLLKNIENVLPLAKTGKTLALIGQLANSRTNNDYIGNWAAWGKPADVVTLLDGIKNVADKSIKVLYTESIKPHGICTLESIQEAVKTAQASDVVILAIGENGSLGGENQSRTNIELPGNQKELINAVIATGKPVVCVLFANRPLIIEWLEKTSASILLVWHPGTEGGNAIADVLFGDYNPSGKLPMTFPRNLGQVPLYYNYLNTGKPLLTKNQQWGTKYVDSPNDPLYPFGFGLSYTSFQYSDLKLNKTKVNKTDKIEVTVKIKNTGKLTGTETAQLYIRDLFGSVCRPVKELRGIQKVNLQAGEEKQITFVLTNEDLKFWTADMKFESEAGDFKVFVGTNSDAPLETNFELVDN